MYGLIDLFYFIFLFRLPAATDVVHEGNVPLEGVYPVH